MSFGTAGRSMPLRELNTEQARKREAVERVREVLSRNPAPDTFLGRQHYDLIPLPYELEH